MEPIDVPDPQRFQDRAARSMWAASGKVWDKQRLVQFIYLLALHEVSMGTLTRAFGGMLELRDDVVAIADARRRVERNMSIDCACEKLLDAPLPTLFLFVDALIGQFPDRAAGCSAVLRTLKRVSPADDVTTHYSNGWLARFAEHLTSEIRRG